MGLIHGNMMQPLSLIKGNKKLIETHSEQIPFKLFQNIEAKATLKPTTTTTSFVNIFFKMQKNGSKF